MIYDVIYISAVVGVLQLTTRNMGNPIRTLTKVQVSVFWDKSTQNRSNERNETILSFGVTKLL